MYDRHLLRFQLSSTVEMIKTNLSNAWNISQYECVTGAVPWALMNRKKERTPWTEQQKSCAMQIISSFSAETPLDHSRTYPI